MRPSRLTVALFAAACTLLALIRVELFATRQQPPVSTICGKLWKNQNSPGGSLHEVSGGAVRTTKVAHGAGGGEGGDPGRDGAKLDSPEHLATTSQTPSRR